jgi:hypothetical protein
MIGLIQLQSGSNAIRFEDLSDGIEKTSCGSGRIVTDRALGSHTGMSILRFGAISILSTVFLASSAHAQCRTADAQSANMIGYMKSLATATAIDSELVAKRQRYHVPAATASQVTLVSTKKTCSNALAAYKLLLPAGTPAPTSLYLVAVGNVYLAWIPAAANTEWSLAVVFDSQFVKLESFTS